MKIPFCQLPGKGDIKTFGKKQMDTVSFGD